MDHTTPELSAGLSDTDVETLVANTPVSGKKRKPILVAAVATLGALLLGYDTGVISGALPYMTHSVNEGGLGLTNFEEGLINAILLFGAAIGGLTGGRLSDRYGRRHNIILLSIIFFVGALGTALAPSVMFMYPFRFILGLAVGGASATVPVYLAETAPKHLRGTLVAVDQLMIVTGQLLALAVNAIIANTIDGSHAWRYMLFFCSLPAIALYFGIRLMPESARWYALKGRYYDAVGSLKRVRDEGDDITGELKEMATLNATDEEEKKASWRDLRIPWVGRTTLIGIGIAILQQTTGINTVMYYAPKILMATGQGERASITAAVANGLISVIASALGLYIVTRISRRKMLIAGLAGIALSHVIIGFVFWTQVQPHTLSNGDIDPSNPPASTVAFLVLGALMLFLFFNQGLQAPANWALLSEIFPHHVRGLAMGLAMFCLWVTNAIITWVFPVIISNLGGGITFGIFAAINVGTMIFTMIFVPETKFLTLEELESKMKKDHS